MDKIVQAHKQFWDRQQKNNHLPHLSDCSLQEYSKGLRLSSFLKSEKPLRILEVGVGTGRVVRELYEMGHSVSAMDISPLALYRVRGFCEKVFFADEAEQLPDNYFDLIICGNVIQHIPTDILIPEFKEVFRSLSPTGTLAVHFVSRTDQWDNGQTKLVRGKIFTLCCFPRSPKFMVDLFTGWGGKVVFKSTTPIKEARRIDSSTILHIQKKVKKADNAE